MLIFNSILQKIVDILIIAMTSVLAALTAAMVFLHFIITATHLTRRKIRLAVIAYAENPEAQAADFMQIKNICSKNALRILTDLKEELLTKEGWTALKTAAASDAYSVFLHRSISSGNRDYRLLTEKLICRLGLHGYAGQIEENLRKYAGNGDAQQIGLETLFSNGDEEVICRLLKDKSFQIILSFRQVQELFSTYAGDSAALYRKLLDDAADSYVRRACLQGIGKKNIVEMKNRLLPYLSSDSLNIKIDAIRSVGLLRMEEASETLCRLIESPDWQVRQSAVDALSAISPEKYYPQILKCLCDKEWWVRYHAASALLAYPDRERLLKDLSATNDQYANEIMQYRIACEEILKGAA